METFFILLIVVFLVAALANIVAPPPGQQGSRNGVPPCPPHAWKDDPIEGGLKCDKCRLKPGQISSSYDKPY